MQKQIVLTAHELEAKRCPACGASIEIISGHWLLRDCALCAWCRRWFALPEQKEQAAQVLKETLSMMPGQSVTIGRGAKTLGKKKKESGS
jgi:hypothetical protein